MYSRNRKKPHYKCVLLLPYLKTVFYASSCISVESSHIGMHTSTHHMHARKCRCLTWFTIAESLDSVLVTVRLSRHSVVFSVWTGRSCCHFSFFKLSHPTSLQIGAVSVTSVITGHPKWQTFLLLRQAGMIFIPIDEAKLTTQDSVVDVWVKIAAEATFCLVNCYVHPAICGVCVVSVVEWVGWY